MRYVLLLGLVFMSHITFPASGYAQEAAMDGVVVELSAPVVVALSAPGEERWGYHQFPTISRLPDWRILVTYNNVADEDAAYGHPGPAFVSNDGGKTWTAWTPPDPMLTISHSVISPVNDGEYLCVPQSVALDIDRENITLPLSVGSAEVYGTVRFYRLDVCQLKLRTFLCQLPGLRWTPGSGRWRREDVSWDVTDSLVRRRAREPVARPYIDNHLVSLDGVLYYADFHQPFLLPNGAVPKNYAVWCMASHDNGRSWQRRGLVAYDPTGKSMMGEPSLAQTSDGRLVCVIRCANQEQKPMLITHSTDGGKTWSTPRELSGFGVMPQLLPLKNRVMVLSFGRPGVHLMFSADGTGDRWSKPLSLVGSTADKDINQASCGYTRLLATGDDSFLIAYSDFQHKTDDGICKAIMVRQIRVRRDGGQIKRQE